MSFPAPGLEHESAPMVRALLWKEWREQQPVVAAGIGLVFLIPLLGLAFGLAVESSASLRYQAQLVPFLMAAFVWPVFAAICGANAGAERDGDGGEGFLLSRPAPRGWVWSTKLIAALAALAAVVVCSYAVSKGIELSTMEHFSYDYFISPPLPYDDHVSRYASDAVVYGAAVVAFCGAFFFSMVMRRPLAAALVGLLLMIPLAGGGLFVASVLVADPYRPTGIDTFLHRYFASVAAGLLTAAYLLFRAGSRSMVRGGRPPFVLAVSTAVMIAVLGTSVSAVQTTTPDNPTSRHFALVETVPTRSLALVQLTHDGFAGSSFWVFGPHWPLRRVTPGKTQTADIIPGEQWIVYDTRQGRFGLRRDACSLRVVRIDGTDDRLIHEPVPCDAPRVLSPDGSRVALFIDDGSISLVSLRDGAEPPRLIVVGAAVEGLTPLWWIDAGVVLEGSDSVHLLDVATGVVHEVFDDDAEYSIRRFDGGRGPWLSRSRAGHRFLVKGRWDQGRLRRNILVDANVASTYEILPYCVRNGSLPTFANDGRHLFWVGCDDGPDTTSRVWMRDLDAGTNTLFFTADVLINGLSPSPSGSYVLVRTELPDRWRAGFTRFLLVRRDGDVRDLTSALNRTRKLGIDGPVGYASPDPPWDFIGWFDDETLALERSRSNESYFVDYYQFAYLDVSNAESEKPVVVFTAEKIQ